MDSQSEVLFNLAVVELLTDLREFVERVLFLAEVRFEGIGDIDVELVGQRNQVAVGGDLVVF